MTRLAAVVLAVALLASCAGSPSRTAPATTATTAAPTTGAPGAPGAPAAPAALCGTRAQPPATYAHVVWVVMENHSYGQVIGTKAAPYQTGLAEQCGTLTDWATVGSPSLPNYIGATAGNTFGIADDNSPSAHPLTADNLFRQVRAAGKTERSYQEDMPGPCSTGTTRLYAVKHNPAAYFSDPADRQACLADDVPLGTPTAGALAADLANGTLPTFALITPNLCNDTHDCSVPTGDAWLRSWIPKLVATPSYQAGDTAIVLTYDEYSPVPNAILAASVPPKTRVTAHVDHYALLRATEELLGLNRLLGQAASAPDLRPLLNL